MDKKTKIRTGLFFGIVMMATSILQDLLTRSDLTIKDIMITILSALIGGGVAALLFVWLLVRFDARFVKSGNIKIDLQPGETILFDTGANHFKGIEGVGGKLFLTNKRLVFKSHKFNFQNHELSISSPDINKVGRYKILGLVNNGLSVTTSNNKTEKFVVQEIDEWLNRLGEKYGIQEAQS